MGLKFLQNKDNPDAFEPVPTGKAKAAVQTNDAGEEIYTVEVEGVSYTVAVSDGGDVTCHCWRGGSHCGSRGNRRSPSNWWRSSPRASSGNRSQGMLVQPGQQVSEGESIVILEAMKMETSVSAPKAGQIIELRAKSGDSVTVGDVLLTLA